MISQVIIFCVTSCKKDLSTAKKSKKIWDKFVWDKMEGKEKSEYLGNFVLEDWKLYQPSNRS